MCVDVLFLVSCLVKYGFAAFHRASKGLFSGVNAKVIKQIVPFFEDSSTMLGDALL